MNCGERIACPRVSSVGGATPSSDGADRRRGKCRWTAHQERDRDHQRGDDAREDQHRGPPVMVGDEPSHHRRHGHGRGARLLEKVLKSALGNAEDLRATNIGTLVVVDARVDGGPIFKRIQPCSRGMAYDQEADGPISRGLGSTRRISDCNHIWVKKSIQWISSRHHGRLEEPLVCLEAGISRSVDGRLQNSEIRQEKVPLCAAIPKSKSNGHATKSRLFCTRPGRA